jgi:hypothetical protein
VIELLNARVGESMEDDHEDDIEGASIAGSQGIDQ